MEETTDVKRKMTPSVPANYVSILQLRERWIKEKEQKRKGHEEAKDEERRRNQHAEEQQTIEDDPKKPREDLDEKMRLNQSDQKHWGRNSTKDESIDGGEASWGEEEETAAIGSDRGEDDDGLPEKKRGRRKRYHRKKKKGTNQEVEECGSIKPHSEMHTPVKDQIRVYKKKGEKAMEKQSAGSREHLSIKRVEVNKHQRDQKHWGLNSKKDESTEGGEARWGEKEETSAIGSERGEDDGLVEKKRGRRKRYGRKKKITIQEVEECGSIKPPEYTVKENYTPVKDQIRVYRKKENKSVEKAVTAIETQFEHLSIKRGQETKHLKAQTRSHHDLPLGRVRMPVEMAWVKKGQEERAVDGNGSGVKTSNA